jgi:hypothetical protein
MLNLIGYRGIKNDNVKEMNISFKKKFWGEISAYSLSIQH